MIQKKKQARSEVPKKQWWRVALEVVFLLLLTGLAIIVSQFATSIFMVNIWGSEVFTNSIGVAAFSIVSYTLTILITIVLMHLLGKRFKNKFLITDRVELGLRGLPTWTDIGLALVGLVVYFLLAGAVVWIFSLFPWFDAAEKQEIGFNLYAGGTSRIIAFFSLTLVAPIVEEILFRGWLYGKMRNSLLARVSDRWSMAISAVLVSVLFGIVHGQWNVGVNVFAMSLVMCGMREITGTIYSGMLLHILKNVIAFCAIMMV